MLSTFQAAAVAFIALIPGATYIWSAERRVGRWGTGLPDMLLRYLGVSAVLHFFLAPLTFVVLRNVRSGLPIVTQPFSWKTWLLIGLYLVVPALVGTLTGTALRHGWRFVRPFTALRPPRAWDHLFDAVRTGG
jgi:hypothetical protein